MTVENALRLDVPAELVAGQPRDLGPTCAPVPPEPSAIQIEPYVVYGTLFTGHRLVLPEAGVLPPPGRYLCRLRPIRGLWRVEVVCSILPPVVEDRERRSRTSRVVGDIPEVGAGGVQVVIRFEAYLGDAPAGAVP